MKLISAFIVVFALSSLPAYSNPLAQPGQCIDMDGSANTTDGSDAFLPSSTYNGDGVYFNDNCRDASTVVEGFCQLDSSVGTKLYNCEFGCQSGRCLSEPNVEPSPEPSPTKRPRKRR